MCLPFAGIRRPPDPLKNRTYPDLAHSELRMNPCACALALRVWPTKDAWTQHNRESRRDPDPASRVRQICTCGMLLITSARAAPLCCASSDASQPVACGHSRVAPGSIGGSRKLATSAESPACKSLMCCFELIAGCNFCLQRRGCKVSLAHFVQEPSGSWLHLQRQGIARQDDDCGPDLQRQSISLVGGRVQSRHLTARPA